MVVQKHPLEDRKSWELEIERFHLLQNHAQDGDSSNYPHNRRLKHPHHHHHRHHHDKEGHVSAARMNGNSVSGMNNTMTSMNFTGSESGKLPSIHIQQKGYDVTVLPPPNSDTMQALMIDAGSQGTRIHVYEFKRRVLYTPQELTGALNGFKLSIPTTNTRWTNRLSPGLDSLASFQEDDQLRQELINYLGPLLHFARTVLDGKQSDWYRYPIYLKATGGLRTLPTPDRIRLINAVRDLFQNKTFNPFEFSDVERARVISGEEEAMYGWAAVNFAIGTLVKDSEGKGEVLNPHRTWGMLEMGGASTQIAWFQNNGDIMADLMKLQIGGARHWNIYAHSFLYFGVNGAWSRLNARLYQRGINSSTINPCLPSKSSFEFESWIHYDDRERPLPRSDPRSVMYNVTMSSPQADFERCSALTRALLRKEANKDWVDFSHDGDCSFAGVYQPPLPKKNSKDDEFIITSNYYDVWQFLQLPQRARIKEIQEGARRICAMDLVALVEYNSLIFDSPVKEQEELIQYCFRATLTFEMLHSGYGFPEDYEVESADVVNGQKLGWALGSTLYEINTLPWEFGGNYDGIPMPHEKKHKKKHRHSKKKKHRHSKKKKRKHHLFAEFFGMANPSDEHDGPAIEGRPAEGHWLLAAMVGMTFLLVAWRRTRLVRGRQTYQSV